MKWTSLLGSLVLGVAVCTQSYGFELLDRMLGCSGCGCNTSCCETSLFSRCHRSRCCNDGCGAVVGCTKAATPYQAPVQGPTCAAKAATPYQAPTQAPCGGCDKGCNKGCGCHHGWFDRLFSCNKSCHGGCLFGGCHRGCCDKGCGPVGCTKAATPYQAPACGSDGVMKGASVGTDDIVPMPPAPVVDPSAFIPTQRRVVQATASLVR
jgi:hypothetical protein